MRSKMFQWPLGAFLIAELSACSIYPSIEETHIKDTYEVVRDIRCESRDAVAAELMGITVGLYADKVVYKGFTGRQLVEAINNGSLNYSDINWQLLNRHLWANWEYYINSTISYDFTLQVEEKNDQDLTLGISATKFGSPSSLPIAFNNDHTRNVERNFFIFDTWDDLFKSAKYNSYCNFVPERANFQYPLAGKLKIAGLIKQFVDLNQSGNLSNKDNVESAKVVVPTMSDTLTFTTKIAANFDPAAIVGATIARYTLTNVTAAVDNSRQDLHKVIIVVSLPQKSGGFTVTKSLNGSRPRSSEALSAEETARQRDNSTKNALIQLGSGFSLLAR